MSNQMLGIVIGGVLPAICFGISAVFTKASNLAGVGIGPYILLVGLAVVGVGVVSLSLLGDSTISFASARYAVLAGLTWAVGAACFSFALARYRAPVSILVPLYNMNTVIAVVFGLWVFSEWQSINLIRLVLGTLLIILGGVLVSIS
ncbi:MAG: hypothetical protein KDD60_06970 [Bdellovibrionales bacterium]|nr:hypothetical protein [Bdellovibrionales bacterium]